MSFNLSVDDYNINELKDLLNLIDPYTLEDIVDNENRLREKLLMDSNVSKEKKTEIGKFLKMVKKILMKSKKEEFINLPTDELIGNLNHPVPKRVIDVTEKINVVPRDETVASGVSKNTIHKLLCLDSRFRDNYYDTLSTDYKVTLPTVIKNVVSMELSALEFPTSYYQISKSIGNNYMWLRWNDPCRIALGGLLTGATGIANDVPLETSGSTPEAYNPQGLYYYISIPDGNYQRAEMMRTINDNFKIATQPYSAVINLFQQLGAYYKLESSSLEGGEVAWISEKNLAKFIKGWCAYPQISIGEFSLKTTISYVKGNIDWLPMCVPSNDIFDKINIGFAFAISGTTVDQVLDVINNPNCDEWLNVYFNRKSNGGSTQYEVEQIGTNSRYSGGQITSPEMDIKSDQGLVSNLGWILGYRLGEYGSSLAYVSEGCYDAWGTKYLYVVVNDYNKNVNNFCIPSYNESLGKSNVLARISTSAVASKDFGSGINLTNNVNNDTTIRKRYYFGPVDVSKLELQITDEFGRILDLNNMDYSMAINLICLYD